MVKEPPVNEEPKKPYIFLFLAALCVGVAIAGYVYEDDLFLHRPYRDITFHTINVYFIMILVLSMLGAFFGLFCFLNPRVGNRLLGREDVRPTTSHEKLGTVTYSVFADSSAKSIKAQHRARKTARHQRHKFKKTPVQKAKKD